MLKALMLILQPIPTWDRIVAAQRKWSFIFCLNTLPLLLFSSVIEGYGLMHWGKDRGELFPVKKFSLHEALIFEAIQFVLTLAIVFLGAALIRNLASTFRGGRTFNQSFTV